LLAGGDPRAARGALPARARRSLRAHVDAASPEHAVMSALLEAIDLGKRYGDFTALDGVNLAIAEGELVSIVGPNGAGKTTLVNLLTGLLPPTSGRVRFKGEDIAGIGPVNLAKRGMAR